MHEVLNSNKCLIHTYTQYFIEWPTDKDNMLCDIIPAQAREEGEGVRPGANQLSEVSCQGSDNESI